MKHAPISDALLSALLDTFIHLETYLIAYWDEVQRKRVRDRVERVTNLLREELQARQDAAKAASDA